MPYNPCQLSTLSFTFAPVDLQIVYRLNQSSLNTFDNWVWNLPQTFIACAFIFNLITTCFKIHTVKKFSKKMACKKFSKMFTLLRKSMSFVKKIRQSFRNGYVCPAVAHTLHVTKNRIAHKINAFIRYNFHLLYPPSCVYIFQK